MPSCILINHHGDAIKWRYLPFVMGIHRSPVNSHHKGQWRGDLRFLWSARLSKQWSRRWFKTPSRSFVDSNCGYLPQPMLTYQLGHQIISQCKWNRMQLQLKVFVSTKITFLVKKLISLVLSDKMQSLLLNLAFIEIYLNHLYIILHEIAVVRTGFNSLGPGDTYMRHWNGSPLAQIMACRLFSVNPLFEPMLQYC